MLQYKPGKLNRVFKVKFLHDIFTVCFYSINTEMQMIGHLLVGVVLFNKMQKFCFAFGKLKLF